jgi:5'-3' exonuclease
MSIILVDSSWFCFFRYGATSVWYSKHKKIGDVSSCNIECEEFMEYYNNQFNSCIAKIKKKFKTTEIYWFADTKQSELWRMEHLGEYKAKRESCDEIGPIISWTFQHLIPNNRIIKIDRTEADDGIAVAVQYERSISKDKKIYIISGDSDLLQLCDINCWVICPKGNPALKPMPIHVKLDKKKLEVSAEVYLRTKIILGDKTDEIPSIGVGIGPKTAYDYATNAELFDKHVLQRPERLIIYERNKTLISLWSIPINLHKSLEEEYIKIKEDLL